MTMIDTSKAQHTPIEVGVSFAKSGQAKVEKRSLENRGFFQDAFIWNLRSQMSTNGIQNLSAFFEGVSETREYDALVDDINGPVNAHHKVTVTQTSVGVETMRNLVSTGGFRVGVGVGLGIGMGVPSRELTILTTREKRSEDSEMLWLSFLLTATVRARYTVYREDRLDIGITLAGRYWGFPAIGPFGPTDQSYSGPEFRTLHQVGYLAGVSVGY